LKRSLLLLAGISLFVLGTPLQGTASAADPAALVTPKGLDACAPDYPVVAAETRVAASLGAEFLSCFTSEKTVGVQGVGAPIPFEVAFAIRLAGGGRSTTDLDQLVATVTAQWKDFKPLGKELRESYIVQLNAMLKDSSGTKVTIASVKPVLVSIDRLDSNVYTVVSIRSYVMSGSAGQIRSTKVNADAVVLRDGAFIRLTMQRELTDASDVDQLRAEASAWARAVEGAS
jgi:hypothetical protein